MNAIQHVTVGSTNPVKIAAVQVPVARAFPSAQVIGLNTDSGVSAQPWGDAEARRGALNRARNALTLTDADLGVGLEGGMVETELGLMTCAWCVVLGPDGRMGVGGGVHMLVPPAAVQMLRAGDELGPAMDRLSGQYNTKQTQGAVGILTSGLSNRQSAYEQLVAMALAPFLQTEYYQA
jgi:inosine/xanthosine triphosphatase